MTHFFLSSVSDSDKEKVPHLKQLLIFQNRNA